MNYKRVHDSIIERAKNRKLDSYTEKHHIIPKCMNGTNDPDNLVELTAREHFIIHKLLCEIYPDNHKLQYAHWAMVNGWSGSDNIREYKVSSREYERLKKIHSDNVKEHFTTWWRDMDESTYKEIQERNRKQNNPNWRNKWSDRQKERMSKIKKGQGLGESNHFYGKTHSNKAKKLISEKAKERYKDPANNPRATSVRCVEDGRVFDTIKQCAEYYGLNRYTIYNHCKGKYKTQKFEYHT